MAKPYPITKMLWVPSALVYCVSLCSAYTPGKFYYHSPTKERVIGLTFDDGPGPFTPRILQFLKEHHIHGTFFLEGDQVPSYPQFVRQVRDEGHEIGNHTFSHWDFHKVKKAPASVLTKELAQTEEAIRKALQDPQFHCQIVRMPYGYFNKSWLLSALKDQGYALVHWTFGTDWFLKKSADQMAQEYIKNASAGGIFLFHDGGKHREKTFAALQAVIPALEKKGYRFVSAQELLNPESPKENAPSAKP